MRGLIAPLCFGLAACGADTAATENMAHAVSTGNNSASVTSPPSSPPPSPSPSPTPSVTRAQLDGAWVDDLDGCAGDTALFIRADGTWSEGGNMGPWSLDGDRLTFRTTEILEPGEDGPPERVDPPEVDRWTVTAAGKNRITLKGNGKRLSLAKCP